MREHVRWIRLAAVGATAAAGGCLAEPNERLEVGTELRMETLRDAPTDGAVSDDAPSLQGLSREGWAWSAVVVPVDGTDHRRTYSRHVARARALARNRGEYPTAESALEIGGKDGPKKQRLVGEAILSPAFALVNGLMIPVNWAVRRPPCTYSPGARDAYERTPESWGARPPDAEVEARTEREGGVAEAEEEAWRGGYDGRAYGEAAASAVGAEEDRR